MPCLRCGLILTGAETTSGSVVPNQTEGSESRPGCDRHSPRRSSRSARPPDPASGSDTMDHKEQHHEHKQHEREQEKSALPFHPLWLLVVGIVLTLTVILVWIFLSRP